MDFSLIIPTYREAENIPILVQRISQLALDPWQFEVLIIDDNSNDGTQEIVQQLQHHYTWLKIIVRKKSRSLSQSVIDGFNLAKYPLLITMDADLSHPPEKIPHILDLFNNGPTDFVIGSRYVKEGRIAEKWPWHRKVISWGAALIARWLIATAVKDPLSGFFALKKSLYNAANHLEPIGWKIGLELIIKCNCKNIREIPIHFSERLHGQSKLNLRISLNYVRHIQRLFFHKLHQASFFKLLAAIRQRFTFKKSR